MIEKQHLEKGFFPHQRWLVGEKFRRGWMIVLFLLTLLPLSQTAKADQDYTAPAAYGWTSFKYPETMHIGFELVFFNYHEGNCGYVGPVNLYVDGELAIDLRKIWDSISDQLGSEKNVRHYIANMLNDPQSFSTTKKGGTVTISNLREGNNKWYACHVDIILDRILDDNDIVLKVSGTWKWTQASDTDKSSGQATRVLTRTIKAPTVTNLPTFTVSRPSKGMAKLSSSLTKHTYPNAITKGKAGTWGYKFHFAKKINKTDFWPLTSDRYTIIQAAKNSGTLQNRNATDYDAGTDATSVAVTMNVPSLYAPTTIYPLVTRFASEYTIFPYNNKGDKAATKGISLNKYTSVVVYGYPRPNPVGKGNASSNEKNAMNATHDQWKKTVTLTWYPQFYDSTKVNTDGKWIIFRKIEGSSEDFKKIGEVAYSKYGAKQNTFVDTDQGKLYDTQYRYTVVFQPNEWNQALTSPSDAPELSSYVLKTIPRTSPLQSLNPSTNFKDKVEITCNLNTFYNAGTDANKGQKEYTLNLYRCTPSTSWGSKPIATYTINDSTTTTVVFTDTNVSPCETYKYKVEVTALEKTFSLISSTTGSISGSTEVTSVVASRGTFSGTVRLTWNVTQVGTSLTYFNVQRRLLGSQDENDFLTIYTTSGVATSYSYEDNTAQPGTYYEYRVQCYRECDNDGKTEYSDGGSQKTDGFALATGIISGRVSFGTGTAVDSVKVSLEANSSDGETLNPFHSLRIEGTKSYVYLDKTAQKDTTEYFSVFSNSWTAQLYYRSDSIRNSRNTFFDAGVVGLCASDGEISYLAKDYFLNTRGVVEMWDRWYSSGIKIKKGKFYNISFSYNNASPDSMFILRVIDEDGNMQKKVYNDEALATYYNRNIGSTKTWTRRNICFGNTGNGLNTYCVANIDECRIWRKALTDAELMRNYNRVLSGSEDGLWVYYKFDEGIEKPSIAYDYSKTAGTSNGNHGKVMSMDASDIVPNVDQLSICGLTDANGNYTISGIPFSGDGTSYTIRPSKGVHEFTPTKSNRFVSAQSLVHNGVDFEDISSFPVSGKVYYYGTNIPVEGVQFSVDGTPCTKDGSYITTNSNGEFTISVPIGNHYISASKNGHKLCSTNLVSYNNKAYFPSVSVSEDGSDAVFNTYEFIKELKTLTFYDQTLVPIAGRVTGGAIEDAKPLGLGQSVNNIGQATIKLSYGSSNMIKYLNATVPSDNGGTTSIIEPASEQRTFSVPEDAICNSTATVGTGDNASYLIISTDPVTGEFAAMVPPLNYTVNSVSVNTNHNITFSSDQTTEYLDASNPLQEYTDSADVDGEKKKFNYVASLRKTYRSTPVLKITQKGADTGAFGEKELEITTTSGKKTKVKCYNSASMEMPTKDEATKGYQFGKPIFLQNGQYTFDIYMNETYLNYDKNATQPDSSIVPLSGYTVRFSNELGVGTSVLVKKDTCDYANNDVGDVIETAIADVALDENGRGTYTWRAGLPNIVSPYTRSITVEYINNGNVAKWEHSGFQGIILGEMPSGNNFVTSGPDDIFMVLRDPAGSASSSYIEEGQTNTTTVTRGGQIVSNNSVMTNSKFGLKNTVITGVAAGALVATSVETECLFELNLGLNVNENIETGTTNTRTVTTTKRISTSEEADYVGAVGDVFIGSATNYIFGKATQIAITQVDEDSPAELKQEEVTTIGTSFGTEFLYTQNYVENVLIPNFESMRDSIFEVVSEDQYNSFVNNKDKVVYLTKLKPGADGFGSNNFDTEVWGEEAVAKGVLEGPSYKMVLPQSAFVGGKLRKDFHVSDTISWFNAQISAWKQVLANNEKAKVTAIQNRNDYLDKNYSFDSGSSLTSSTQVTTSKEYTTSTNTSITIVEGLTSGATFSGVGVTVDASTEYGGAVVTSDGSSQENTMEVGFTLMESGDDDALTVDVLNAPDGFGPIFYTRGGQTSCPYEDEVVTNYYNPGFVIQQKTMQIEKPQITAKETSISGVPSGKPATFTIYLQNISETKEDCWFNLSVSNNPNGASVSMDGKNITGGSTILVPAGERMTKTIQISQTSLDYFDFENLKLTMSSICQPDNTGIFPAIEDSVYLSVHFQQMGSNVALKAATNSINLETDTTLTVTISDFDRNARGLKMLQLQTRQEGDMLWKVEKEWVVEANDTVGYPNRELLPTNGVIQYVLNMKDNNVYPDGNWNVRAVTISNFSGDGSDSSKDVTNSSEIFAFSKDLMRPQLISNPSPSNGVLTADGEIALTFNEDIRYGALTSTDNFFIRGELNDSPVAHDVAMNLTGGEGAKTSANVDLGNRSFAVNMWMRYSEPGEIFTHGTTDNNMKVGVDANGKLTVSMGGNTFVSNNALQKDKWQYLSFSYDAETESLSANYAYDAYDLILFSSQNVGQYTGNGKITLGKGMTGQMHDVALWNYARPWSEAQGEMYEKKTRYSDGLMGYWQLDEGHGTAATDCARSRTLTLPSASAWYLAGDNYALNLNGSTVAINAGAIGTDNSESYTSELWFRADADQKGKASIFGFNSKDALDIYLAENGQLRMTANAKDYAVSSKDFRDNQWHHLALNVLKSTSGSAIVYVDGVASKQVSSSEVPALATSKLLLGGRYNGEAFDQPFNGSVDEVRVWHGRRTADVIINKMYERVSTATEGLVAYYPFEKDSLGDGNILTVVATMSDMSATGAGYASKISGIADTDFTSANTAALKKARVLQNVDFDFTGSDRKILIRLAETPQRLENCTVTITVRGVRDAHSNKSEDITWDVYVRQNQLIWQEAEVNATKHGTENVSFEVGIANNSSSIDSWTISNLPSWLSVNAESGSIPAISERTLKFTINPSLNIGNYEAVVYLTGSLGISEPLVVKVSSTSEVPDWSVNPADYEYTMNIYGQLNVGGRLSQDGNDIIAAFRGDRCVGLASPIYFERYDAYYVLMNVYGNNDDFSKPLTYKAFDASTGCIHPVVKASNSNVMTFVPDNIIGTMNNPNIWTATDEIGQDINLIKGWQWISTHVSPSDNDADEVLAGIKDNLSTLVSEYALWTPISSTLTSINVGEMYKAQLSAPATLTISGLPVDVASTPLTIKPQWNWIGYTASGYISLGEAFADLDPQDGDVIKGHKSFATWSQNEWVGTLTTLATGEGYQYFSSRDNAKQFCYPSVLSDGTTNAKAMTSAEAKAYAQAQNDIATAYSGNMSVIATVLDFNGMTRNNVEIRVIDADNNLRALSREAIADRHFITIAGEEHGAALRFIVNIDGMDYIVPGVMFYNDDAIIGTYNEPLVIDLSSPTGIGNIAADNDGDENTYNLAGQRIDNTMRRQVVIRGNKKVVVRK